MIKWLKSRLSMKVTKRVGFLDIVSGNYVRYWVDCYGVEFMSVYKFSHRVNVSS